MVHHHAHGPFTVTLTPQPPDLDGEPEIGRLSIDKHFHGDLEGVSKGQMISFRSPVAGSAGYVAMERVEGSLSGRTGSFVLQHSGVMSHGAAQDLIVNVVPDSGTGGLSGLTGTMTIGISGKDHVYDFEYTLNGD